MRVLQKNSWVTWVLLHAIFLSPGTLWADQRSSKAEKPLSAQDLAAALRGPKDPEKDPSVKANREAASKLRAEAQAKFAEAGKKIDQAKELLPAAADFRVSLTRSMQEGRWKAAPPDQMFQIPGTREVFRRDPKETVNDSIYAVARTHASMGRFDPKDEYLPTSPNDLPKNKKSELPDVTGAEAAGKKELEARSERATALVSMMESKYWRATHALQHDCDFVQKELNFGDKGTLQFKGAELKDTAYLALANRLVKTDPTTGNRTWACGGGPKGVVAATTAERKILATEPPTSAGILKPGEKFTDSIAFAGIEKGQYPLTHEESYLKAHSDSYFAHNATRRLATAHFQKDSKTLLGGTASLAPNYFESIWSIGVRTADLFTVWSPVEAWAQILPPPLDPSTDAVRRHFTSVEQFNIDKPQSNESPDAGERHFFKEASESFKEAEKVTGEILKDTQTRYTDAVKRYNTAKSAAEAAIAEAEAKNAAADAAEKAANDAAKQASNGNDDKGNDPNGNKGGGGAGPQKGGGGEGNAGQRAQLTPVEPAKIPNQTDFPGLNFPQKPEEAGVDPRLAELSARGAANAAALGDLSTSPVNGGQIFQGVGPGAPVSRGEFGFNPRNILSRGVPTQPRSDAGGAIANGAGQAANAALAGGAGGAGPNIPKGGGDGGGGMGGNFENGIGYDPNGNEGARQRQTFSETVAFGAGNDGGSSTSNGDAGPTLAAQIAALPGANDPIFLGKRGERGAKGEKVAPAAVGILSYVTNLSPLLGERVKKIDFKEAFAKANPAGEGSRDPASLPGASPSLASPSLGGRINTAIGRDGDTTAL